uniref:Integrase catalytic domain-containing protein n=1 Tax=Tanacetum cinerariifolium TaxID=118510 RepID=A0A6L2NZN1_TANCI|nr:hypothetical protein [Tanacetum cinerariifolium]
MDCGACKKLLGDKDLNTIPEKELDEFIKFSVEDLVPIPSESEDTSGSDSEYDLPSYDAFSPIDVPEGKFVAFSNPLFDSNDDFTSSGDESLSDEDVPEDNDIESKASYDSNLDEPDVLVTPLFDTNEDECFDPGYDVDEINAFDIPSDFKDGYYDSKGDVLYLESLLSDDTTPNLPPEVFLDREPRSLSDINDLKIMVKVFDPGILEKFFSPTYVSLSFKDHHYYFFTYVIQNFLPYFTYLMDSLFLLSSGSEDTIFDLDISAFHSLAPVASHQSLAFMCFNVYPNILNESPMEICSSTRFNPNITMIWVNAAYVQLVLLVYKVTAIFNKVNAAKSRVTTAVRVSTTGWIKWLEDQDMRAKELKIYSLGSTSAIEKRYRGNKESKKVQRTLLKQQYENFAVSSSETLNQTFDRALKNQENRGREYGRKTMPVENPTENAVIAQDRFGGYDWSYQDEEEHLTNYALMALTSSESSSSSDSETLMKSQVSDKVNIGLGYKADSHAEESFVKSSEMLKNQENVKSTSDKGYDAVPPPYTGNYIPPKPELMFIDEQVESEFVDVVCNVSSNVVKTVESKVESVNVKDKGMNSTVETKPVRKNNFSPSIIEDWNFDDESEVEFKPKVEGNPQQKEYKEKGVIDSGCSRHMAGNECYLTDYEDYDGGFISFGDSKGRVSRKGKIKTGTLDFNDVYFCKELKYNMFSVLQMFDKKNNVLFTKTECLVLSSNFKLLDESQVLLRVPRKDNIYSVDLKSVVPTGGLTCLFTKATTDESNLWHRRLGHINYITMSKIMRGNLMSGLLLNIFKNNHGCVACQKGKQHKASYKAKLINSISKPLHMLHMDLFGPTNVKSLMKKSYCLVITDDFSRFSWAFFLATKNKTSGILKTFITGIENQLDYKVKVIRYDNGTEFKNSVMNQFCDMKRIKMEFNVARTPQQNGVAKRKNRTLIEAARTMALIIKPHNKIPYELICGRPPLIDFMKPFGCPVTILNTIDYQGKFDEKANEGFFVGYSMDSAVDARKKSTEVHESQVSDNSRQDDQDTRSSPVSTARPSFVNAASPSPINAAGAPATMEEEVDMNNAVSSYTILDAPLTKFLKDHPKDQVIVNIETPVQTRQMTKINEEHGLISSVQKLRRTNHKDFQNCLFACYLSQMKPKKPVQALKYPSWVEEMQDELLQFKLLNVWTLVDLPKDKWAIGTKWIFRNKKDEKCIVIKNKARLVAQGHTQEEEINYDEVFAPVARIEAIKLFLAYASFKYFVVYQMDIKSAFLYGKIEEEVHVCQPPVFEDPNFLDKVYKVEKALYGLHQAPRAWYETLSTYLMDNGLQVQQKSDGIFISQDKYVADILKKFNFSAIKTASTPMKPNKALVKDAEAEDVDVHLYRSMIRSLMYLTTSRPNITFAICACARFQATPKTSHLHAMKRIFRYLKGQPKLGLWYPKDSPFKLEAYSDSDYAGANLDRKSTIEGCQFLGKRMMIAKAGRCFMDIFAVNTDKTVYKEWEDRMERAVTTASSLEAEQDSGNINRTQSMAILNEPLPQGTGSCSGPRINKNRGFSGNVTPLFETMMVNAQEKVGKGSGLHTDSHYTPTDTQPSSSKSQKKIKPKRKQRQVAEVHSPSSKIPIEESIPTPSNDPLPSVDEAQGRMHDAYMFGVNDLEGNEVIVDVRKKTIKKEVSIADPVTTAAEVVTGASVEDSATPTTATTADVDDELTLAKTLIVIKAAKPKDKGKAKMIEPEKPLKKKDHNALDEEVARRLEAEMKAELEKEERIAREKAEANRVVIEE